MSDPTEPLEPDLAALIVRERAAAVPGAALGRVRARLAQSVLLTGAHEGRPSSRASASPDATTAPVAASAAKGLLVVAAVTGGVAGAGLHALLRPAPKERIVYVDRPSSAIDVAPSSAPAPSEVSSASLPPAAPAPAASTLRRLPSREVPTASSLAAEREILDDARKSLAEGDAARALALAEEHAHRFSRPQLAEEREALAIQALVIDGQAASARDRAGRFRATWPDSLFLPAVEASIASIP